VISALSTILALLGGIKEVRNMFVMASTNRLAAMDDAILRRLSGKFFVGRPSIYQRKETFEHVRFFISIFFYVYLVYFFVPILGCFIVINISLMFVLFRFLF
jgi:hypothetical protein